MWRGALRQRVKSLLMTQHHSLLFPTPFHHHPPPSTASLRPTTMSTASEDDIFKHKKIIRTKVKKSLRLMNPALRSHEDDVIQRLVLDASWFKSSRRLCAYISCSALREVDTSKLLSEILHGTRKEGSEIAEKKLYVPHVEDMNCHMRMLKISSIDDLIANYMDILEPAAVDSDGNVREDVMQANEPCDLFLLPGLAFDKSGRRLGRGGGILQLLNRDVSDVKHASVVIPNIALLSGLQIHQLRHL